jgi:hypothetical protein
MFFKKELSSVARAEPESGSTSFGRARGLPAALLAEALAEAGDEHDGGLGVRLAHLVPPVVRLLLGHQVRVAPLRLAPRPAAAAACRNDRRRRRRAPPRRGRGGARGAASQRGRHAPPRRHGRRAGGVSHGRHLRRHAVLLTVRRRRRRAVGGARAAVAGRGGCGERGHGRRCRARGALGGLALAVHGGAGGEGGGRPGRSRCGPGAGDVELELWCRASHEWKTNQVGAGGKGLKGI